MSVVPIRKKLLLAAMALATVMAPIIIGAVSSRPAAAQAQARSDRDVVPIVRINPEYPPSALAAQLEGEVNLQSTITATGTTKDIAVVESTTPEFEAPAIAALQKWRYMPATQNDQPVEVPGVRTIIRFELADAADEP